MGGDPECLDTAECSSLCWVKDTPINKQCFNQFQSANGKGNNLDFGLLDERMLKSIFRRDALVRVQSHHAL